MTSHLRRLAAAAVLTCVLAPAAAAQQRETEQVDRTIPFQPGGTLRLKNFSGDVRITGADAPEVVIHAVRRAPRARLDRIRLTIETSDAEVVVNANDREDSHDDDDNVVDTTFDIRVPRQTSIDLNAFSSTVTIEGVDGRHRVQTFSGDVRLYAVDGPLRAKTFSGDVELRLAGDAGADVRFSTFSGDIRTDMPLVLVTKSRKTLHATLNGGGRELEIETFSGDVRLDR
jgi:DUF4097 and DUF4098 domain-containing protein YvlB